MFLFIKSNFVGSVSDLWCKINSNSVALQLWVICMDSSTLRVRGWQKGRDEVTDWNTQFISALLFFVIINTFFGKTMLFCSFTSVPGHSGSWLQIKSTWCPFMFVTEMLRHILKNYQFTSVDKQLLSKHPSCCLTAPALLVCQSFIPTYLLISHKL